MCSGFARERISFKSLEELGVTQTWGIIKQRQLDRVITAEVRGGNLKCSTFYVVPFFTLWLT